MPASFTPKEMPKISTSLAINTNATATIEPLTDLYDNPHFWSTDSFTPTYPQWIAINVNPVAAWQLKNVLMHVDFLSASDFTSGGTPATGSTMDFAGKDWTIRGHANLNGGVAPPDGDAGWVTLLTITGNPYMHRLHVLGDVSAYKWIEIRFTSHNGTSGIQCKLELFDASIEALDTWIIFGDSTTNDAGLDNVPGGGEWPNRRIAGKVNTRSSGKTRNALIIPAGDGGQNTAWFANSVAHLLASAPTAKFALIQYGLNDSSVGAVTLTSTDADTFQTNMLSAVDYLLGQGLTVVLGQIQWSNVNSQDDANAALLNARIRLIYTLRPAVIPGADMYTAFHNNLGLLNADKLHPSTSQGYEYWQSLIVDSIFRAGYAVTPGATQQRPGKQRGPFPGFWRPRPATATQQASGPNNYFATVSDTLTPATDSLSRLFQGTRALAESNTGSDSVVRVYAGSRALSDSVGPASDAITRVGAFARSPSDILTAATDAVTRAFAGSRAPSDSVGPASDAVSRVFAGFRSPSDILTAATDAVSRVGAFFRAPSDSVGPATDAVTRVGAFNRSPSDILTAASDAVARVGAFFRPVTESLSISDAVSATKSKLATVADVLTPATDAVARLFAGFRTANEAGSAATDAVTRQAALARSPSDILTPASDSAVRVFAGVRAASEAVSASDAVVRQMGAPRSPSDVLTPASDVVSRAGVFKRLLGDVLGAISDLVTGVKGGARTPTQAVAADAASAITLSADAAASRAVSGDSKP